MPSSEDELTLAQVMLPEDANLRGNVHGGTLMKLADTAGGVCATRHARRPVATVVMNGAALAVCISLPAPPIAEDAADRCAPWRRSRNERRNSR